MPLWTSVDFSLAVTRALLLLDWGVAWDAPRDRLVPPVPGRLNYLLWVEDLLAARAAASWPTQAQERVLGIDIGTGASCIFPVLGHAACGWDFVGTELDPSSLAWAARIVEANSLEHHITLARASADGDIIGGVVRELLVRTRATASADGVATASPARVRVVSNDPAITAVAVQSCWDNTVGSAASAPGADFSMCNPPFFGTWEEATASMAAAAHKTVCTGTRAEMVTVGGETAFVERMARESARGDVRGAVTWYTTMLGKHESVPLVRQLLRDLGVPSVRTTTFRQGSTSRWGVAWSWLPPCAFLDEAWSFLAADDDSGSTATAAASRSTRESHNSESVAPPACLDANSSSTFSLSGVAAGYSGIGGVSGSEIDAPGLQPVAGNSSSSAGGSESEKRCELQAVSDSEVQVYASAAATGVGTWNATATGLGILSARSESDAQASATGTASGSVGPGPSRRPDAARTLRVGAAGGSGSESRRHSGLHPGPPPSTVTSQFDLPALLAVDSEFRVSAAAAPACQWAPMAVGGSALAHWQAAAPPPDAPPAAGRATLAGLGGGLGDSSSTGNLRLAHWQADATVPRAVQVRHRLGLISGSEPAPPATASGSASGCYCPVPSSSYPVQLPTIWVFPVILTALPAVKYPALQAVTVKVGRRRLYATTVCAAQRCTEPTRLPFELQHTEAPPLAAQASGAARATGKRSHNDSVAALRESEGLHLSDRGATPPRLAIEIAASRIEEFLQSPPPVASDPSSAILSFQAPTHSVTVSPSLEKGRCIRAWRGGVLGTASVANCQCATVTGAPAFDSTAAIPEPSALPSLLVVRFLYEVQLFAEDPEVDGAARTRGQSPTEGPAGCGSSSADATQEIERGGSVAVCLLAAQDPASRVAFDRFARALERDTLRVSRKWRRRAQGAT